MPRQHQRQSSRPSGESGRCTALTTSGNPCKRARVPGLTVCKSHGGGTAASARVSKQARISQQAASLWGISPDAGGISVKEELEKLARNKITDIIALRLELGKDPSGHIGMLTESSVTVEYDIEGTVQSKYGSQKTRARRAGTSPYVQELHKAEMELVQILRLLQEVSGDGDSVADLKRVRLQTAREAARLLKAFPGISVDEVASEVSKGA